MTENAWGKYFSTQSCLRAGTRLGLNSFRLVIVIQASGCQMVVSVSVMSIWRCLFALVWLKPFALSHAHWNASGSCAQQRLVPLKSSRHIGWLWCLLWGGDRLVPSPCIHQNTLRPTDFTIALLMFQSSVVLKRHRIHRVIAFLPSCLLILASIKDW